VNEAKQDDNIVTSPTESEQCQRTATDDDELRHEEAAIIDSTA